MDTLVSTTLGYLLWPIPRVYKARAFRAFTALVFRTDGGGDIETRYVDTRTGNVRILVYKPASWTSEGNTFPVYVNLHGGGFVVGSPEKDNFWCRQVADGAEAVVISVDYAKAPEHKFPTPVEQTFDVLHWLASDGGTLLNINPNKLAIGGFSAGASLALAIALKALPSKDFAGTLVLVGAFYPEVDRSIPYLVKKTRVPTKAEMNALGLGVGQFLSDCYITPEQRTDPLASPSYAADNDLSSLPKTLILVGDKDLLCVESQEFAERLERLGVDVVFKLYPDAIHQFTHLREGETGYDAESKADALALTIETLKQVYA